MDSNACTVSRRQPWNKGKLVGQKAPLKLKEIWAIRVRLQLGERLR
ncbi:MAG: integrase, partial [Gammaproteobacteria bacterium]